MLRAVRAWASSSRVKLPPPVTRVSRRSPAMALRCAYVRCATSSRHRETSASPSTRTDGRRGSRPRPPCTAARRPRPSKWRALRTNKLASDAPPRRGALFARNLRPAARVRIVADGGDIASAFARAGALVLVVFALLSGTVPVPGSLGVTLAVSGVLWAFAALATRITVSPVLRFGDRMRLGWHRLDADALAAFVPTGLRVSTAHPGRVRALAAFPLSVVALVAIDAAESFARSRSSIPASSTRSPRPLPARRSASPPSSRSHSSSTRSASSWPVPTRATTCASAP